jgi:hypothetical protein
MGDDVAGAGMSFGEASLRGFTAANFAAVEMSSWLAGVLLSRGESEARQRGFW